MEPGTRPLPTWFDDAKLGIFVHWTAAAVPAFAPVTDSPFDLAAEGGWEEAMRCSPYVEWYQNSVAIEGSPARPAPRRGARQPALRRLRRHVPRRARRLAARALGRPVPPGGGPLRRARHQAPRRRAALAQRHPRTRTRSAGRPSATWSATSPAAVRSRDMRFGTYYSGGLDWTFGGLPITRPRRHVPGDPAVARVPRLRRRALARADRALPPRRAVERHRLPGGGRPRRPLRPLLRGGARGRREQPVRLDGASRRAPCTATS